MQAANQSGFVQHGMATVNHRCVEAEQEVTWHLPSEQNSVKCCPNTAQHDLAYQPMSQSAVHASRLVLLRAGAQGCICHHIIQE